MSDFKVGDCVRRTVSCGVHSCEFPPHQDGWEGTVGAVGDEFLTVDGYTIPKSAFEKVDLSYPPITSDDLSDTQDREDKRIQAWYRVADHPVFRPCIRTAESFVDAVLARLDELADMEMTINELKPSNEDVIAESIEGGTEAPRYADPGVRLRVLELALSHMPGDVTMSQAVQAAETLAAWVESR